MSGFIGSINRNKDIIKEFVIERNDLIVDYKKVENFEIKRCTINKFLKDKVFYEDETYFILTEGVILNSKDLLSKYNKNSFEETIITMYEKNGNEFFNEFRGSFSGIFFNKEKDEKIIYTDHIGSKQVFYVEERDNFIFGTTIDNLVKLMRKNNIEYTFNEDAAYCMLTYGFNIEEKTFFNEIKKVKAGTYLYIKENKMEIIRYHLLDNTPNYNLSEKEIIEKIDILFRQAIKRAFEKDKEYDYKHLVALSGGLDSRMTTWVAHDMGYNKEIVNYTFSQNNHLDETVPKKISSDLKHEWIFKSLDNGLFLENIDETTKISSGGAFYLGLAHGNSMFKLLNKERFGLVHSGQLGDVIVGTYSSKNDYTDNFDILSGANSKILKNKIEKSMFKEKYKNEEIFKMYQRGFGGINQGLLISQYETETYSPFYDLEFLEFCFSIPLNLRLNHNIYYKWILNKYPKAATYKYEKLNGKITDIKVKILGKEVLLKQLPKKLFNKFNKSKSGINSKKHMNPIGYWYKTNSNIKLYLDNYYEENIGLLRNIKLEETCKELYTKNTPIEKLQVLSLLSVLKLYFKD